jgi:signal transduction histidine kinase
MIAFRSLRFRVLVASILWTLGLLGLMHFSFLFFAHRFPLVLRVDIHPFIIVMLGLMIGGLLLVSGGLSRFSELRARLAAVRDGTARRVEGRYPTEVQPLVNDLNALLEHREEVVQRALAKAGDLAHGLKTPLAVIAQEAERHDDATIRQQVERMRRQIDYHLAHARAAGSGATVGAQSPVLPAAEGLVRVLQRLHADRRLAIDVEVGAADAVRAGREDLDEMLGNLLDNACKWATSRVRISSSPEKNEVVITVDDDGPGLDPSMREAVLQRGVRADEAAPGFGFGLAIVRDLAELYGGSIALDASPMGGLRARLRLPSTRA